MKSYAITLDRQAIEVLDSEGCGLPVFFFHGNSGAAELYAPLLQSELGRRYRMLAISFPSHGNSAVMSAAQYAELTIAGLGRWTASVCTHFGFTDYVLAGQSLGGHALLEAMQHHPHARALCLISAPPISLQTLGSAFAPDPTDGLLFRADLDAAMTRRFAQAFVHTDDDALIGRVGAQIASCDGAFRAALGAGLMQGKLEDEVQAFADLRIPTTVFAGEHDRFLQASYYASLSQARLWRGAVQMFPGCGHAVNLDDPSAFEQRLGEFLDSV